MSETRRALLRKLDNVDAFPMVALQALRELRGDLDAVEAEAIIRARELGASLEDIAQVMEMTRQGVAYKLKALTESGHAHNGSDAEDQDEVVRLPEVEAAPEVEAPRHKS